MKLKETDIPERLQLKCPNRASPDDQEILEEAEFIYNTGFTSLQDQIEKDDLIERISNVLRFLWKDHFEIPFIATYRKDHWYTGRLPVKGKEDQITEEPATLLQHHLWEIYDWDEKYLSFKNKKSNLKQLYEKLQNHPEIGNDPSIAKYLELIETNQNSDDITDYQAHFHLHYSDFVPSESKYKRPVKRNLYTMGKKAGIREYTKAFGLTAKEFGENIEWSYAKNEVRSEPDVSPLDYTKDFVNTEFSTPEEVLKAARHMMAKEISLEPSVRRTLRQIYNIYATVSTFPTENGKREIDFYHPLIEISKDWQISLLLILLVLSFLRF